MPVPKPLPALLLAALATAQEPGNRYQFPDFRTDFPFPLELPQHDSGPPYSRSRRQALEHVVEHLKGDCRREVWLMAMEFFARAPKDAALPLIEAMDRAYTKELGADVVKNCVDAMGAMGDDSFDEALRRALEHPNLAVRQAAFAALGPSGKAETVLLAARWFPQMDGKARAGWLRAARLRLGAKAVPIFADLMQTQPVGARDQVLTEVLQLPADQGATVLTPMWPVAIGEFKVIIAGVRHGAGDMVGTVYLRDLLLGEDPAQIVLAVRNAARFPLGVLREDILRLSLHGRPEVRLAVVKAIAGLDGEDVVGTLEVLAQPQEIWEVKAVALKALTAHGKTNAVTALLEDVQDATGTRLQMILDMLSASGDGRVVPVFAERFAKSPAGEGRPFLQAMAFSGAPTAFQALAKVFLGPERAVVDPSRHGGPLTTINYVPVLMQNLRSAEAEMVAFWQQIPPGDVRRRACYLSMVANVAADRADPAARKLLEDLVRSVLLDKEANAQLRVLALNLLSRKTLTVDDAMTMKQAMAAEAPPMRALFHDYLSEFF
jgi:hypothetical protein